MHCWEKRANCFFSLFTIFQVIILSMYIYTAATFCCHIAYVVRYQLPAAELWKATEYIRIDIDYVLYDFAIAQMCVWYFCALTSSAIHHWTSHNSQQAFRVDCKIRMFFFSYWTWMMSCWGVGRGERERGNSRSRNELADAKSIAFRKM